MGRRKHKSVNNVQLDNSKTKFRAKQTANASVGQGGNAFAINANELGVIRVRTGGQ
ncbi:hypothetical protein [Paenibacillus sp. RC67]|uniref:hypothetical protein n=1 Tax=Paenibacillus sp. RC67 TaxID=3039392 RepID=UPI0024ACF4E2|nr:hypothetical protein [Paenibacillus sp. RC67]